MCCLAPVKASLAAVRRPCSSSHLPRHPNLLLGSNGQSVDLFLCNSNPTLGTFDATQKTCLAAHNSCSQWQPVAASDKPSSPLDRSAPCHWSTARTPKKDLYSCKPLLSHRLRRATNNQKSEMKKQKSFKKIIDGSFSNSLHLLRSFAVNEKPGIIRSRLLSFLTLLFSSLRLFQNNLLTQSQEAS